ncbi:MAG: hypothetical protein SPE05_10670 [Bacteroidales bacterium]|nr:hypothetical protein [Bacteroidales bacterium]
MKKALLHLGAVATILLALVAVGCTGSGNTQSSSEDADAAANAVVLSQIQGAEPEDSANAQPLFEDTDGTMDSLLRAKGYVFGNEIVKASQEGNVNAQYLLAQMYAYGICGARPNRTKAFRLYTLLADNGVAEAKAMAGYMMLYGFGTEQDARQGLQMVAQAANADCGLAYLFLGDFYSKVEPSKKNIAYAKSCYNEAVRLGVAAAQIQLDNLKEKND